MNGPIREETGIEYKIRKYQRSNEVIKRTDYECQAMGGEATKTKHLLDRAAQIIQLKRRLLDLTGRCSPLSPKWPI